MPKMTSMNTRFLLTGAVAGGLIIFMWGLVSHIAVPWPGEPLKDFSDPQPMLEALKAHTSGNGVYLDLHGVFAAVNLRPDMSDQSDLFGPRLVIQLLIEIAAALLLSLLVLGCRITSPAGGAGLGVVAALAAGVELLLPSWNWFNFSTAYAVSEMADIVIGWTLAGLALGWLAGKMKLVATRPPSAA